MVVIAVKLCGHHLTSTLCPAYKVDWVLRPAYNFEKTGSILFFGKCAKC
jgi:hypothetical protein